MTNQLCSLNVLEGNSAISSMLNGNEFLYQNFYIQPQKSAYDSSFVSFRYQGTLVFFTSSRSQAQAYDDQGSLFYFDKIRLYHTNGPSNWRRESLFRDVCY